MSRYGLVPCMSWVWCSNDVSSRPRTDVLPWKPPDGYQHTSQPLWSSVPGQRKNSVKWNDPWHQCPKSHQMIWACFYLRPSKVLANGRRRYLYNVFSHWLRPWSAIDSKCAQMTTRQRVAAWHSNPKMRHLENRCQGHSEIWHDTHLDILSFLTHKVSILEVNLRYTERGLPIPLIKPVDRAAVD